MNLEEALKKIKPVNNKIISNARGNWDSIAKPLRSLGLLEEAIIKIAGIKNSVNFNIDKKALVIMCADNGIVEEGVTQTGQEVTAIVTENFTNRKASVSLMSEMANVDVFPVDIGVYRDFDQYLDEESGIKPFKIINRKIAYGTKNFLKKRAMTEQDTKDAIMIGVDLVKALKDKGYNIIATGEMGIGNTTTSSAIAAVLLHKNIEEVTGKGAGLSNEGLEKKIKVIKEGIRKNKLDYNNPLDVLSKVGGLDIAGMVGLFIGGAIYNIPVVVDGFISGVSALVACRLNPNIKDYLISSHVSKEPAGTMILEELELKPLINCEMCLGEGSGAIAVLPLLDMAWKVYSEMSKFSEFNFEYKPL